MTENTAWVTCPDCQEIEGSVVLCDEHRPQDLGDLAEKTASDLDEVVTRLNDWVFG